MRHYRVPLSCVREHVTLWEFAAMAANLPVRDSAVYDAVDPEGVAWDLHAQLQAAAVDSLRWLQWAQTKDGEKNRNRPKPIPRPGVEADKDSRQIGSAPLPLSELDEFLGWRPADPIVAKDPQPRDARGRFVKRGA